MGGCILECRIFLFSSSILALLISDIVKSGFLGLSYPLVLLCNQELRDENQRKVEKENRKQKEKEEEEYKVQSKKKYTGRTDSNGSTGHNEAVNLAVLLL